MRGIKGSGRFGTGFIICIMLAACGGEEDGADDDAPAPAPTITTTTGNTASTTGITSTGKNRPPIIAAVPDTQTLPGSTWSFSPSAHDPDGDTLKYRIYNRPRWASFDENTGRLSGTPTSADLGTFAGINIGVTDGTYSSSTGQFSVTVVAGADGRASLSWIPPTENTDGTTLTDLAGYVIHWGTSPGSYTQSKRIDSPGITSIIVENLLPGQTYYFAARAFNTGGVFSGYSGEVSKGIR